MKKGVLAVICLFVIGISACSSKGSESGTKGADSESGTEGGVQSEAVVTTFLDEYEQLFSGAQGGRTALVYLDDDSVPELLILKDGEYQMFFFDGSESRKISLPNEVKANAYGTRYAVEGGEDGEIIFYWFEYVPRKGLVRIHGGENGKRRDHYLSYEAGVLNIELEADDEDYTWNTYDAKGKITNEEFSNRLAKLGYDSLICCTYLYEDVKTAYENIGRIPNAHKALEDFASGKADAVEFVEKICEAPEQGFAGRNFAEINEELTAGESWWEGAEHVDFDNDGKDELILHGYAGARLYFDAVGDMVYKVLKTGSTTDVSYVAEMDGKRVVVRTDLTHAGRQYYWVMTYDGCGCLTDWFELSAEYEEAVYGAGGRYEYRDHAISGKEFEAIRDSICDL